MFGFLTHRAPKTKAPRRTFRPRLECLEERVVLDNTALASSTTAMLSLSVMYGPGKLVTLYGHLTDTVNSAANKTVTFHGKVEDTTTTDSNGDYTLTELADGLGNVTAETADSNVASVTLADVAPSLLT